MPEPTDPTSVLSAAARVIERSHEALKDHQRRLGAGQPEVKIDLPLDDDLKAIVDALEFRPTLESLLLIQLLRNQKPEDTPQNSG